jgi:hypothetical protein
MFIVWGKKVVHRKIGYVADFCPLCREPKPFLLNRVGVVGHVYYISFGEGQLAGYERVCQSCKTRLKAEPSRYSATPAKFTGMEDLCQQTFPGLREAYAERLGMEEKLRRAPGLLSVDERRSMIGQPFVLLSPVVEARFASTHIDKEVGLSLLGTIVVLCITPGLVGAIAPDAVGPAMLTVGVIGTCMVIWQGATAGRRFIKRKIAPALTKSLHPLNPSEREIQEVLAELKRLRHKIGSKVKPMDILRMTRSV